MANIAPYLADILAAVYGEQVRGSIHDAIKIINDVSEVILTTGTAVDSASSSSEGFFTDSLYWNIDTYELWKCTGTNAWLSLGTLKGSPGEAGEDGVGIESILKTATVGLVDTYTITYTDGGTDTFTVTNGADGEDGEDGADGNKWYRGTGISGKSPNPTVYSNSGIEYANANDFFMNPTEGAIYHCVSGGTAAVATWAYDFTMSGGGGGGTSNYNDLTNKPQIAGTTLSGNKTLADLGIQGALTAGNGIDITGSTISADMGTTGTTVAAGNHTHSASISTSSGTADVDMAANTKYALTMGGDSVIFKTPPNPSVPDELSDLTGDVSISTPQQNQILQYNGSKWANANMPTIPTVDQTYSSSSTNAQSGTAVEGAISGKLDGEVARLGTSADGQTVSFLNVDITKAYDLFADLGTSYNGPPVGYSNVQIAVTSGDMGTITFTLVNGAANMNFELVRIGS